MKYCIICFIDFDFIGGFLALGRFQLLPFAISKSCIPFWYFLCTYLFASFSYLFFHE